MNKRWLGLSIVVGFLFVLAAPAWPDYQTGSDAYDRGDYETALKEFRPLAEQGDALAQFNMGVMFAKGQGVSQYYQEAVRWYRKAAERGHASAQFNLGLMYYKGQGLAQEYQEAAKWFRLAAEQGVCNGPVPPGGDVQQWPGRAAG